MRAPLLFVALAFAVGILCQPLWPLGLGGMFLGGLAVLLSRLSRLEKVHLALLLFVAAVGCLAAQVDQASSMHSLGPLPEKPRPVTLKGTLVSDLEPARYGQSGWLKVQSVRMDQAWQPVSGKLRLQLPRWAGGIGFGDSLRLMGLIRAGKGPSKDHAWDEARWLWLHQAQGVLKVADSRGIERLRVSRSWVGRYRQGIAGLRLRLKRLGRNLLSKPTRFYLESLLLGERSGVPKELKSAFRRTGTIQILPSVYPVPGNRRIGHPGQHPA